MIPCPSWSGVRMLYLLMMISAAIVAGLPGDVFSQDAGSASAESAAAGSPAARYLIIHSDDAGMSQSVNSATIRGMQDGFVSSCSIMVPCPWFTDFAEFARQHPELDYGIHLSHLDTHMGTVVSSADLLEIYVRLGLDYQLPVMLIRHPDAIARRGYPDLVDQSPAYIRQLEQQLLPVLDHLYQFYEGRDHAARRERYLNTFRNLKPGVTQMIIHCGTDNAELQAITGSHFLRGDDTRIFTDPEVLKEIQEMGIQIINWQQLREMQFPATAAP